MNDTLLRDLRFASRTLARTSSFTAAVIATIGLAVGATTAMVAVVDGVLLRPLPFSGSADVVALCEANAASGERCGASPVNVADWERASEALERAGVARTESFIARSGGEAWGVRGGIASPGFLEVLRLGPIAGRLIEERDMARGANRVALVSHRYWRERLGGDRSVVGRPITLDDEPFTVIGVLPADAYLPGGLAEVDVWKPLTASVDNVGNRAWRGFTAIGRRGNGVSAGALAAELETIRSQLEAGYPEANKGWSLRIVGLREHQVNRVRGMLWIFLGAVAIVLLIGCANVASLLLVRAAGRRGEFAVRAALGAGRWRLTQQLITESLVLSAAGGAVGVLLATWATDAFVALAPGSIPRLAEVAVDGRVVLFAFALSAATAVVFSIAPARQAWAPDVPVGARLGFERAGAAVRGSNLQAALSGSRGVAGAGTGLRSSLVVAQLALALMLLFGAGLLARGFGRLVTWDPGFDREGLVTSWMLPPASASNPVAVMERVRDEVAAIPGVKSAALASAGPLFGGEELDGLRVEGRAAVPVADVPVAHWFDVSPHYFDTLGVRLLRGRPFTDADSSGAVPVGIVNETLVRRVFGAEDPIGQRITVRRHTSEIVGVVADTRPLRPDEATRPQVFWPIRQYPRGAAYLVLRTTGVGGLEAAMRARAASVNAGIQLTPVRSLDEWFGRELVAPRFNMLLVLAFAVVALLLGAVGVYGVIAYALEGRRREIGVRLALGATPGRLVSAAVGRGMMLSGLGISIGCVGALLAGRLLSSLIYGLPPTDPLTLAAAVITLGLVAAVACWIPARRASRMDPTAALRTE